MKSIVNKTHDPLRIPLPHGKVLHLGPNKTGQVSVHDADHPPLKKMLEAGKIEIFDQGNEAIPAASSAQAASHRGGAQKSGSLGFHRKTADSG